MLDTFFSPSASFTPRYTPGKILGEVEEDELSSRYVRDDYASAKTGSKPEKASVRDEDGTNLVVAVRKPGPLRQPDPDAHDVYPEKGAAHTGIIGVNRLESEGTYSDGTGAIVLNTSKVPRIPAVSESTKSEAPIRTRAGARATASPSGDSTCSYGRSESARRKIPKIADARAGPTQCSRLEAEINYRRYERDLPLMPEQRVVDLDEDPPLPPRPRPRRRASNESSMPQLKNSRSSKAGGKLDLPPIPMPFFRDAAPHSVAEDSFDGPRTPLASQAVERSSPLPKEPTFASSVGQKATASQQYVKPQQASSNGSDLRLRGGSYPSRAYRSGASQGQPLRSAAAISPMGSGYHDRRRGPGQDPLSRQSSFTSIDPPMYSAQPVGMADYDERQYQAQQMPLRGQSHKRGSRQGAGSAKEEKHISPCAGAAMVIASLFFVFLIGIIFTSIKMTNSFKQIRGVRESGRFSGDFAGYLGDLTIANGWTISLTIFVFAELIMLLYLAVVVAYMMRTGEKGFWSLMKKKEDEHLGTKNKNDTQTIKEAYAKIQKAKADLRGRQQRVDKGRERVTSVSRAAYPLVTTHEAC